MKFRHAINDDKVPIERQRIAGVQHASSLWMTLAISLALAYLSAVGVRALRLPPLIGYVIAGIAIGPFTPGFVADLSIISQFADIGVALLLFGVGIHFSLADLVAVWRVALFPAPCCRLPSPR